MADTHRNGNIECLRFLFAVCVVLLHSKNAPLRMSGGYLAVEFFFMLSGLFLGRRLRKTKDTPQSLQDTVHESGHYILRRIGVIFPYFLPAAIIGFTVRLLCGEYGEGLRGAAHVLFLPHELLFLQNLGFSSPSGAGVSWYLSALFFAMWLLYPILRRHYTVCVRYFAVPVALIIVGILNLRYGYLNAPNSTIGPFNTGILRAVAMLLLGAAVGEAADLLRLKKLRIGTRALMTVTECLLYACLFVYMAFSGSVKGRLDQTAVLVMAVALLLTVCGQSLLYGKADNRFSDFLGKCSMLLFLNHYCWVRCTDTILGWIGVSLSDTGTWLVAILLTMLMSVVDWALGNALRRFGQRLKASV